MEIQTIKKCIYCDEIIEDETICCQTPTPDLIVYTICNKCLKLKLAELSSAGQVNKAEFVYNV